MTEQDVKPSDISVINAGLADAISALGTADFMDALTQALRRALPFENAMLFAYQPGERPRGPYTDIHDPAEARIVIDQYLLGPFLLDPFYGQVQGGQTDGLARLGDIAPDRFFESEYFEQHYRRTRITDEVGFFFALPSGATLVYSLTRRHGAPMFSTRDMQMMQDLAPLICALARQHWGTVDLGFAQRETAGETTGDPLDPVSAALAAFGDDVLSERQGQVVGLILKGHSTEAIALNLSISADTVKVHRRNAYAKLGVSSQAELFATFLALLSQVVAELR